MHGPMRPALWLVMPLASLGAARSASPGAVSAPAVESVARAPVQRADFALPAAGELLVELPGGGLFVVERDGVRRRLGEWYDAAWSPDGQLVAAARGRTVAALGLDGRIAWSVRRSNAFALAEPDWAADGLKLAYRSGDAVRVVDRDGSGDRRVAGPLRFAGPRWRPGLGYMLAWADRRGRVRLLDVAGARTLWKSRPGRPARPWGLVWSRDGTTLAAVSGTSVRVFDAGTGRVLRRLRAHGTQRFEAAAFDRSGSSRLILVRHDIRYGGSRVTTVPARRSMGRERRIFAGRGRVIDLTFSPDGRWLLLGWRGANQWRFVRLRGGNRVVAVRRITRRLNRRPVGRWAFPSVRGWCCPP
jgi:hypothetical protein